MYCVQVEDSTALETSPNPAAASSVEKMCKPVQHFHWECKDNMEQTYMKEGQGTDKLVPLLGSEISSLLRMHAHQQLARN